MIALENTLNPLVRAVADLRDQLDERRLEMDALKTPEFKAAEQAVGQAKKDLDEAETDLRKRAVAIFETTGDKHPHPQVEVVEAQELSYHDDILIDWLITHHFYKSGHEDGVAFLAIANRRKLDSLLRPLADLHLCPAHLEPVAQARIASDLTQVSP